MDDATQRGEDSGDEVPAGHGQEAEKELGDDVLLNVRHPVMAFFYWAAKPMLVTAEGERRLAWGVNMVEPDDVADGFGLEIAYFGFRIGKASHEGRPEPGTVLHYRAPHVIWAPGSLGETAKSQGGGWLVALLVLCLALPVAAVIIAVAITRSAQDADRNRVSADAAWMCPPVEEVVSVVGPAASGLIEHPWNAREDGKPHASGVKSMSCEYAFTIGEELGDVDYQVRLTKDVYDGSGPRDEITSLEDWLYSYGPLTPTTFQRVGMDGVDDAVVGRLKESGLTDFLVMRGHTVYNVIVEEDLAAVDDTEMLFDLAGTLLSRG